ncbi:MBL fold metallo-hydrolase [Nocardia sp. NPDC005366]|uniref:MBL fold metallo-hydrolase n=1 Tax=Nocardia sp. NPDC005366 TaxID=3156878 RepID=UPI0033A04860
MTTNRTTARPGRARTVRLGEIRVSYVPDGAAILDSRSWFPSAADNTWSRHADCLDHDGNLVASIGGLLVQTQGRAMLIDAGLGPISAATPFGPIAGGALLDNLAAIDFDPNTIETVAITHLHLDHVGWCWQMDPQRQALPFQNAEILVSEVEWSHPELAIAGEAAAAIALEVMAPRVRTIVDGEEIFPGVRAVALPGHTIGHMGYIISGGGQRLIAFGDALHSPAQISDPGMCSAVDYDDAVAAAQRRKLVAELAEPATIGFGGHFGDAQFGRAEMHAAGGEYTWILA